MTKAHVLIVEDNQTLAEGIQLVLEAAGYQTEAGIYSGMDALQRLEVDQPDLILMDLSLDGDLDGVETANAIKQRYDIPVVFLTAHGDQKTWQRARETNPHGFLMKPFNKIDLEHVVELALYMHQAEHNLRERETYYRSLFEGAHDAILIYSVEDQIVLDLNQRACQTYGYSRDEFIGMPLASIAVDGSSTDEYIPQLIQEKHLDKEFFAHHKCKDGRHITLEVRASLIPYQGKNAILSINRDVTNRLQEEMELDRHRRQLETMVQERTAELKLANDQLRVQIAALASAANGIIITDRDANIIWSNPAFCQLTGFDPHELLGKRPHILRSEMYSDEVYANMWKTILSGKTWKGELTNRRKDGSLYVAELIVTPVRDDAGQICNYVAVNQDITERIQAEQALRESEFRYRQMLESSSLFIAMFDKEEITYINLAGAQLLGYEQPEQLIGKSISQFMDRDNFQELAELFIRLIENPENPSHNQIIRFIKPDGELRFLDLTIALLRESDPFMIQVIAQDVSERSRAQENLRKQAALAEIELAINQPREMAGVLDRVVEIATEMLAASVGASVLFVDRHTGNLLVGSSNLSPIERNQLSGKHIKQNKVSSWILEHKQPIIIPDTRKQLPGTDMLIENSQIRAFAGVPLIIEGQAVGVLYIMDEQPRDYNKEDIEFLTALANRASLAIAKVEVIQSLEEAKEAAEAATQAKSAFLANMSHELRTPLTAITSLSELLADSNLNRQQTEFVHTIQSSADRLLELIGDVLDFSRLEASRFILEERKFDVRQMIDDTLNMLALRSSQKHLRISSWVSKDVPAFVTGDDGRVSQILINLVSNAVKFTEHGYISLRVDVQPPKMEEKIQHSQDDGIFLRFSVKDTGVGIPPDRHGSLFQAFTQIDLSSSRRYGGTGLGLAISKQLVELMGGDIQLFSSGVPGEGCIFTFTVRVKTVREQSLPYLDAYQPLLAGKQILVVESMPICRSILEEQLAMWGMQVEAVIDPYAALAWLESGGNPQLAILSYSDMESTIGKQIEVLLQTLLQHGTRVILTLDAGKTMPANLPNQCEIKLPVSFSRLYDLLCQSVQLPDLEINPVPKHQTAAKNPTLDQTILLVEDDPVNRNVISLILQNLGYAVDSTTNGVLASATVGK